MNGARSTFKRKGYLLTALAAAVLLAASAGTAEAQRVTIGFDGTSGTISENAFINNDALLQPQMVKIKVEGLSAVNRAGDITSQLGDVTITPSADVWLGTVSALTGAFTPLSAVSPGGTGVPLLAGLTSGGATLFANTDEITLVVAQSGNGAGDNNWFHESIELKLAATGSASVSPDVFTLKIEDRNVAPVATFHQRSFALTEGGNRTVNLDIVEGARGEGIPGIGDDGTAADPGPFAGTSSYAAADAFITLRVSNHTMVNTGDCVTNPTADGYGDHAVGLGITGAAVWTVGNFRSTGLLTTATTVAGLAAGTGTTASLNIQACPDRAGIVNPEVTLTILDRNLVERPPGPNGNIVVGAPLTITVESDEAAPTLSFSPTDVTIDEGGSTETVLLADGSNAGEVGMVKLMVEGDAMVDLYQDGEMLEEMSGYVTVDLGGNSSARLMAMSTSDPDLMDGDTAYKAWKLMEGETDGAAIGDGYWFRVDVRGSTAVPALPLVGQLLLALFLMAGGSRLYRRRSR